MYSDLHFAIGSGPDSGNYLVCSQRELRLCPPAGMISVARIVFSCLNGEYHIQVLFRTIESGLVRRVYDCVPENKWCK